MTIRASQIIPVYPLTEDIQPGDVFLVQTPIDQQEKVYKRNGFLPLDHHVARLSPKGYKAFYKHSFLTGPGTVVLPHDWSHPAGNNVSPWQPAPHAAFPTYSFSVRHGEGINLAVPVDGVPIGLSLLNSDAASGTVTIDKSQTLGVDTVSLWREVENWALTNQDFLLNFGPLNKTTNYLRIVSRVYTAGQVNISLSDASSQSGGLDVGAAKPVNLLFPKLSTNEDDTAATAAQNFTNGWSALQTLLTNATQAIGRNSFLPGGSLRLAAASSRTVALQEALNPPLVIGYLGFDCAVLNQGQLGPPIPTYARLTGTAANPLSYGSDGNTAVIRQWLHQSFLENTKALLRYVNAQPQYNAFHFEVPDIPYILNQSRFATLRQAIAIHFKLETVNLR